MDKEKLEKKYIRRYIKFYNLFKSPADHEEYSFEFERMIIDLLNEFGFKDLAKTIKNMKG